MVIDDLYTLINKRKEEKAEGSYTCYLFEKGKDKILKKIGEESSEVIIAAKNNDNSELVLEICDLTYHLLVLMAEQGISLNDVENELIERTKKISNLKTQKNVEKQS